MLLAVLPGVVGTAVALAVYGAGFSLAIAAAVPWLDEAFDADERGLAYGVQNLLYAGGYAIGPLLGGALLGVSGADLAYAVTRRRRRDRGGRPLVRVAGAGEGRGHGAHADGPA